MNEWVTEYELDRLEDYELVQRAQLGDQEAFGELIRRHRRQVYGYAKTITQETVLAEDIVQDALIRAFLHLGTLVDVARFLPWLHRIVRNQAYTRLKSGPMINERPFSSLQHVEDEGDDEYTDWSNLDNILHRISSSYANPSNNVGNPEERLIRRQLHDMLVATLVCLTKRERQIFESHFFEHLSPTEIAKLFSLSVANVYQILSRSRRKVAQERIRIVVDQYMIERRDLGALKINQLTKTEAFNSPGTWTSVGESLHRMLSYTDQKLSLPMVMGLTGHAFRVSILKDDVHIAGPTMYSFQDILSRGLRNLGWSCSIVETQSKRGIGHNANLIDPELLTMAAKEKRAIQEELPAALDLIHYSVDKGIPVLAWDLFMPEFGIICGYDDVQRLLSVWTMKDESLPYDHLGRGTLEDLFVLSLKTREQKDLRSMFRDALTMVLDHYYGKEEPFKVGKRGLEAYDVWMDAFHGGKIEPNGNAYNIAVVGDARRLAADFLGELSSTWQGDDESDKRIRELSTEAASVYKKIAEKFQKLALMFPFPSGGEPNADVNRENAIDVLQSIRELEEQSVSLLEQCLKIV